MKDCIQQKSKISEHASKACIFCKIVKKEIPQARFLIPTAYASNIRDIFGLISDFHPKASAIGDESRKLSL